MKTNPFKERLKNLEVVIGKSQLLNAATIINPKVGALVLKQNLSEQDSDVVYEAYASALKANTERTSLDSLLRGDALFPYFVNYGSRKVDFAIGEILQALVQREDWRSISYFVKANPDLKEILAEKGLLQTVITKCVERSDVALDMDNDFKEDVIEVLAPEKAGLNKISKSRDYWKGLAQGWEVKLISQPAESNTKPEKATAKKDKQLDNAEENEPLGKDEQKWLAANKNPDLNEAGCIDSLVKYVVGKWTAACEADKSKRNKLVKG